MADVKISQLPAATTPVDGTEVLPIVQSATTKQVSIANLTAGRAMSASSLTLTTPLAVTSGGTGISTTGAGTFVVSATANTISATATPTLGVQQTTQGTLTLANTAAGAWPVTLQSSNSATAAWTMTLPTAPAAANGYILTSSTTGVTSWTNPTALGVDLDVGTTAITNGTVGRVFFQGSGDVLQQNSNFFWDNTNSRLGIGTATPAGPLQIGTTPSLLLDTAGNLGLGVTPSAWDTLLPLQVKNAAFSGYANNAYLSANCYYKSATSWTRLGTDYANAYMMQNGQHQWYNAASGASGSSVTFTQAMTLDASGRLMIGTTSPQQQLTVSGVGTNDGSLYFNTTLQNATTAATSAPKTGINFQAFYSGTSSLANFAGISGGKENTTDGNSSGVLIFSTATSGSSPAERARIDSSGNLLVGQTSTTNSTKISLTQATAFSADTYNTIASTVGTSTVTNQQQSTSVSTTATVILSPNLYASFCVVFGSDGTNRFMDLIVAGLGNGSINVVDSFSVAGSPAARTYSQSGSTYRLAMASGTYTVQVAAISMNG